MKFAWSSLFLLALATPAVAGDAPYYGPMKAWHGWGFKYGFEDKFGKDGAWRVDAATRSGEAIDMAMYRMAERAQAAGYRYVQFLGGGAQGGPGYQSATVWGRPSESAAAPAECRTKNRVTCYTADVAAVMRRLGGPDGAQPGVAVVDHRDQYRRAVYYSGFAIASATTAAPAAPVPVSKPLPVAPAPASTELSPSERYDALLRAAQPVHGREAKQGWTVSN